MPYGEGAFAVSLYLGLKIEMSAYPAYERTVPLRETVPDDLLNKHPVNDVVFSIRIMYAVILALRDSHGHGAAGRD